MPRKVRISTRKRLTRRKGYSRRKRYVTQTPVTIDVEDPSLEEHVQTEEMCQTGLEGTSISDASLAATQTMHLPLESNTSVVITTPAMKPRGQSLPARNDAHTFLGDSENAEILYCVTMPSQSALRREEVDMTVYKLSALHSTPHHLGSGVEESVGTRHSLNNCNTFTVVGMELMTESSDESSDILECTVRNEVKATVTKPAISQELSVTQQLLDSVSQKLSPSNFLRDVKASLTDLLGIHWACAAVDNKILVMRMSRADVLCAQRQLTFDLSGKVSLSVHGDPLPADHDLWSLFPPVISNPSNSVKEFCQHIVTIVDLVRQFEICNGLQDERYEKYFHILRGDMIYDENKYKETRYTTAYRSVKCFKLIALPMKRCPSCCRLKSIAARRIRRYESPNPPGSRCNKRYLAFYGKHMPETCPEKRYQTARFCRVQNCKSVIKSWTQNITLFKAPGDRNVMEKWVELSGLKQLINLPIDRLKRYLTVCHHHFADEDIKGTDLTKILKQNALPVKFPEGHAPLSEEDMNAWRSSKHYKQYWKRLEPKKPRSSKDVIEHCPNLSVDSFALNNEPNGPFPCLYCETVHSVPTSTQEECLLCPVPQRENQPLHSTSSYNEPEEVQEEVANILLSL